MKYTAAALLATAAAVNAQDCTETGGNSYCGSSGVQQIKFNGLDIQKGQYNEVVSMEGGQCSFNPKSYGGSMAPFNEDMAMFFRGPLNLNSMAVYLPGKGNRRSAAQHKSHTKRSHHNHHNLHKEHEAHKEEKRADMVTAVIDGVTVSWENNWFGGGGGSSSATGAPAATNTEPAPAPATTTTTTTAASTTPTSTPDNSDNPGTSVSLGDYGRVAYYDAASGTADGLVFLANKGDDSISGTWDTTWGNSLSYVASDGESCAASPEVLAQKMIPDGAEIAVYSDTKCTDEGANCGYSRPGSVAYKGFDSGNKVFLMEFQMPYVGGGGDASSSASSQYTTTNMPAIWALNGKIARTGQYSECSCWKSGCGEADLFEVLTPGLDKAKATFHFHEPYGLGANQWFARPGDKSIKFAAAFHEGSSSVSLKVLPDTFNFATKLTEAQIDSLMADDASDLTSINSFAQTVSEIMSLFS